MKTIDRSGGVLVAVWVAALIGLQGLPGCAGPAGVGLDPVLAADRSAAWPDAATPFLGSWALVMPDGAAAWLGVRRAGAGLDAEPNEGLEAELWTVGHPSRVHGVALVDGELRFARDCRTGEPAFAGGPPTGPRVRCPHRARVEGDRIHLTMELPRGDGDGPIDTRAFSGTRLPPVPPRPDLSRVVFGEPIELFNGRDLTGWTLTHAAQVNGWSAHDGALVNTTPKTDFSAYSRYGNLRTAAEFEDFNLTLEFRVAADGNSGVYLRGMYEVQVVGRDSRMQGIQGVGSLFGRIERSANAARDPGRWQRYDLTLVDRHVTVKLNGTTVIDNQPIAGCTKGALWADETRPGPIMLQGDHTAVAYRNLVLRPVVRRRAAP